MNKDELKGMDVLGKYMNPGLIEKAPVKMVSRIMNNVQMEAYRYRSEKKSLINRVPLILTVVFAVLITVVLIFPGALTFPGADLVGRLIAQLPDLNKGLPGFHLPVSTGYILLGVIAITAADLLMNRFLRREKK